ncbi:MAG TPA: hypothetical protein VJH03_17545 [Blastocatellia bacterium]|nr:hypothetical protein [Blastocatellia bacterium]
MRRANGDLLAEEIEGRLRVPVWSSREAAERYKLRNYELLIYFPVRLDRSLLKHIKGAVPEFFLLSEDDPGASLEEGTPIPIEAMLPEDSVAPVSVGV